MTKHLLILLFSCALLATPVLAASVLAADVEYSTAGVMDTPATQGGDRDGWGEDFLTRWDNTTGHDVRLEEFGWPCGGWWAQYWYVWISETLPEGPWGLEYYGSFVATSADDTEYPPSVYTYIDVSEEGIVVPAGSSMYFGYANPGMAGQISFNGVETFSWLEGPWDMDGDYGRTTLMQFKGAFVASTAVGDLPTQMVLRSNYPNPFNPCTTISFDLPQETVVSLLVYDASGHLVDVLLENETAPQGRNEIVWSGRDQAGRSLPSGSYFCRLEAAGTVATRCMTLLK